MQSASAIKEETQAPAHLTETIVDKLNNPSTSSDFDFHEGVNQVLADVGMSAADSGGQLTFYGQDPIVPSRIRFATMAGIGLAAKTIAAAAVWRDRTGQGQDIHVDVRKAFRRFSGFFEGIWETVNGRSPAMGFFDNNPFFKFPLFRATRDGRHIATLSFTPSCINAHSTSSAAATASNRWRILFCNGVQMTLEAAAAEEGLVLAKVRSFEEFRNELQYTEVLAKMPLISVEKIGESEPVPFKPDAKAPLDGIRAFGMGHVIAGAAIGRDLAFYGADVLNFWRPNDTEVEAFFWDVQVGMRSTILDYSKEDRAKFDALLKDADIFFANKRPGYLKSQRTGCRRVMRKKARADPRHSRSSWGNRDRGRTGLALMRLVQRWQVSLLSKGLLPVRSSRQSYPSATTLWVGSVLWAFSQRYAGGRWREEVTRLLSRSLARCSGSCPLAFSTRPTPKRRLVPLKKEPTSPRICSPQRRRSARTRGWTSRSTCPSLPGRIGP